MVKLNFLTWLKLGQEVIHFQQYKIFHPAMGELMWEIYFGDGHQILFLSTSEEEFQKIIFVKRKDFLRNCFMVMICTTWYPRAIFFQFLIVVKILQNKFSCSLIEKRNYYTDHQFKNAKSLDVASTTKMGPKHRRQFTKFLYIKL